METLALDVAWRKFQRAAISRPVRSIREFAESAIVIPDGPFAGERFTVERQPWTRLLFEQIDDQGWAEIVGTAPAQGGKTLVLFVIPLLFAAAELRANTVVALPDEEMWGDKWGIDILPVLRASPELRGLVPTSGPGSRDGKPKEAVVLANGVTLKPMTPSGGEHTRSGFTAPIVSMTELYRFTGNPFGEIKARQGAYSRFDDCGQLNSQRRLFAEGTLTSRRELPWALRNADDAQAPPISTESEIYAPCPGCRQYVLWEREHLVGWQDAASELEAARCARWQCPECGRQFGEAARRRSAARCVLVHRGQSVDRRGRVRGKPPEVSRLFFRVKGFDNLLVTTAELAAEEWEAAQLLPGSREQVDREQYLCTKKWAIPYEPPLLDFAPLRASWLRDNRMGGVALGELPEQTRWYATGIDLGKFTCWYVSIAQAAAGALYIVDFGGVDTSLTHGDAQPSDEKAAIGATLNRIFDELALGLPCGQGRRAPDMVFCDSNWQTEVAFQVCRARGAMPVNGVGRSQFKSRRVYSAPARRNKTIRLIGDGWHLAHVRDRGWWQVTLDADTSKLDVQSGLRVQSGQAGSIQLPRSIDKRTMTKLCGHLAAEVRRQTRSPTGKLTEEWIQTGGRHDLLDCAGYALRAIDYCEAMAAESEKGGDSVRQAAAMQTPAGMPFLVTER